MSDEIGSQRTAESAAVARAYVEALADQDLDRACGYLADEFVDDLVGIAVLRTKDEVRAFFGGIFAGMTGFTAEIHSVTAQDDRVAVNWTMRGRFDGDGKVLGLKPNGTRMELRGTDLFTIHDGKIVANVAVANAADLARQFKVLPAADSRTEKAMYALVNLAAPLGKRLRARRA